MSVLRSIESKIAGLVEGTFSRAFRSEVRPVEIARKLAREMEEHRTLSLSRTYVPNEYRVYLSPRDRDPGTLSAKSASHRVAQTRGASNYECRPILQSEVHASPSCRAIGVTTR